MATFGHFDPFLKKLLVLLFFPSGPDLPGFENFITSRPLRGPRLGAARWKKKKSAGWLERGKKKKKEQKKKKGAGWKFPVLEWALNLNVYDAEIKKISLQINLQEFLQWQKNRCVSCVYVAWHYSIAVQLAVFVFQCIVQLHRTRL